MTLKDFITKAREIHRDKYDYSKVEYVDDKTKVCIIDPEYGEFLQTPNAHLQGQGCPKRSGKHVPTTEEWIASARKLHGDKYDYSKVVYVDGKTKVCIICPEHGEFWQSPANHLLGIGCPKCEQIAIDKLKQAIVENFIKKARLVHGDKYDYSKVKYVNGKTKVCIIDPEYGEFWQKPNDHLKGCGCPKRDVEQNSKNQSLSAKDFIKRARLIHGDKYDYSKVAYVNGYTKVCIISPELGEFWQTPIDHLLCGNHDECVYTEKVE